MQPGRGRVGVEQGRCRDASLAANAESPFSPDGLNSGNTVRVNACNRVHRQKFGILAQDMNRLRFDMVSISPCSSSLNMYVEGSPRSPFDHEEASKRNAMHLLKPQGQLQPSPSLCRCLTYSALKSAGVRVILSASRTPTSTMALIYIHKVFQPGKTMLRPDTPHPSGFGCSIDYHLPFLGEFAY